LVIDAKTTINQAVTRQLHIEDIDIWGLTMSTKKTTKQRAINGKQTRFLRGLGHHLSPLVHIGKDGISDTVIASVIETVLAHELIKVKLQNSCPTERNEVGEILRDKTGAVVVQILGKTILLYKENKKRKLDDKIKLPSK